MWAKHQFTNSRFRPGCPWEEKGPSVPEWSLGHPHWDPKPSPHFCRDVSWGRGWGAEASVPRDGGAFSHCLRRVRQAQVTHAPVKTLRDQTTGRSHSLDECPVTGPLRNVALAVAGSAVTGGEPAVATQPGSRSRRPAVPLRAGERCDLSVRPSVDGVKGVRCGLRCPSPSAHRCPAGSIATKIPTWQRASPPPVERGSEGPAACQGSGGVSRQTPAQSPSPPIPGPPQRALRTAVPQWRGAPGTARSPGPRVSPARASLVWSPSGFPWEGGERPSGTQTAAARSPHSARRRWLCL